jgi:hypothetical protein
MSNFTFCPPPGPFIGAPVCEGKLICGAGFVVFSHPISRNIGALYAAIGRCWWHGRPRNGWGSRCGRRSRACIICITSWTARRLFFVTYSIQPARVCAVPDLPSHAPPGSRVTASISKGKCICGTRLIISYHPISRYIGALDARLGWIGWGWIGRRRCRRGPLRRGRLLLQACKVNTDHRT